MRLCVATPITLFTTYCVLLDHIVLILAFILKIICSSHLMKLRNYCIKSSLALVVTPIPKVPKPQSVSDYRPISVTPLLSRPAEKLVVSRWLLPSIPVTTVQDQFAFRPTGSTTCALINMLHHVTLMLERCAYVRCPMIDFTKAFDLVSHPGPFFSPNSML